MSALILPSLFTRQPQYPAPIDRGNPITKGLVSAPSFAAGIDSVTRKPITLTGAVTKVATAQGVGVYCTGGSYATVDTPVGIGTVPPGVTVFVVLQPVSFASYGAIFETNGDTFQLSAATGADGVFIYRGINAVTGERPANGAALTANRVNTFAYAAGYSGNTDHVYVNGVQGSSGTCGTGSNTRSTLSFGIGNGGYANPDNIYLQAFVFNRPLSSGEILSLHQNPWQLFKAPPRFYFAPSAGSGASSAINATIANAVGSIDSSATCKSAIGATTANDVGSIASKSTSKTVVAATTGSSVGSILSKATCKTVIGATTANSVGSIASKATCKTVIGATTANAVGSIAAGNVGACATSIGATTTSATSSIVSKSTCKTVVTTTTANAVGSIVSKATCKTVVSVTTANALGAIASVSFLGTATAIGATTANAVGAINGYSTSKTTISATLANVFGGINTISGEPEFAYSHLTMTTVSKTTSTVSHQRKTNLRMSVSHV